MKKTLLLKDEYDVNHNFLLVDAHTHLRINQLEGMVPSEFIRKFSNMVRDMVFDMRENESDYRFHFPWDISHDQPDYYTYCQKPRQSGLLPPLEVQGQVTATGNYTLSQKVK